MGEAALVKNPVSAPVVRVTGFRKSYARRVAVDGVDLDVRAGEMYVLIGPDGAGKSSLMKAIAGVLDYEGGAVEVFDARIDSEAAAERVKDRIGFMPQGLGLNLYPELSIEENVDFFAELRLVPKDALAERKEKLLAITRLARFRDRPMKQLSGGMKQKLGLVCTLIHEPALVILDEPTTGVDPVSRRDFWAILGSLLESRGITALVSTAYMDEASRFQRLSLMFGGRVIAKGEPEALRATVAGTDVRVRAEPQPEALAKLQAGFAQVQALGPWLHVFVETPDRGAAVDSVHSALAPIEPQALVTGEPELEDVFIALLRREHLVTSAAATSSEVADDRPRNDDAGGGPAIVARALTRDFDHFRAVDRVSFSVQPGEIFGLLGANGAGKTTCIKMLTGILPPTGGEGQVGGADMRRAGRAIKQRIGYMSQAFSLYTDLTVIENIRLYAGIYGLGRREADARLRWILAIGGLAGHENDAAASLPMGLRQRLALGCALVHRPQVLFLDEPTSGVDPVGRRRFWDILFRLSRDDGVAILITTHYMSEAEHCDRLALMYAGRIVADASPEELKRAVEAEAGRLLEVSATAPARALAVVKGAGYADAVLHGSRIHVLSREPERDRQRLPALLAAEGIEVTSVEPRALSMEDVFVYRITALEAQERNRREAA